MGWWPSAEDIRSTGRHGVTAAALRWRMAVLVRLGYAEKAGARQWAVTPAGCELLGVEMPKITRRWRDTKWRERTRAAAAAKLETYEG